MKLRPSGWAWIGLTGYVVSADVYLLKRKQSKGEPYCSMSEGFGDALNHPIKRWPVILVWAVLTVHLFGNFIPDKLDKLKKLDPIGVLARAIA